MEAILWTIAIIAEIAALAGFLGWLGSRHRDPDDVDRDMIDW